MRKFFVAAIAAVFLAGCASQETQPEAPIDDKGAATASAGGATTSRRGRVGRGRYRPLPAAPSAPGPGGSPLRDPANILSKRTSTSITTASWSRTSSGRSSRRTHATSRPNRGTRMIIQGNTDERGSREYNIALGQKRADAVKRTMTLLGAQESADRVGELRQGEAEEPGARRVGLGREPPR